MSSNPKLTTRDREILHGLLTKVRVMSLRQVAEHWFHGELANARRRMGILASCDLLQPIQIAARPLPPLEAPVFSWQPAAEEPDCGAISFSLTSRWQGRAVRTMAAFVATEQAQKLLGGKGRRELPHPTQATHDLGVAAIWLDLRRRSPELADAWRGEDLMASTREGGKLPDAFLLGADDTVLGVIEFGGAYRPERVRDFHQHCLENSLPYQIF